MKKQIILNYLQMHIIPMEEMLFQDQEQQQLIQDFYILIQEDILKEQQTLYQH